MPEPRVSVICVFFNAERFLAEAVESVLAQTLGDFELLLVDDGSQDGGTVIAREYAERRPQVIRYLSHPGRENRGAAPSRNLGIEHACGEFIAFIDADDVWRPSKLLEQVAILDLNPQVGMLCGAVNYWRSWEGGTDQKVPTGHLRNASCSLPEAALALYPLGAVDAPCPSDAMLRRTAVVAVGGFEAEYVGPLQMYEDLSFFAKIYLTADVFFSTRVWLDYRQHADSCVASVTRDGLYLSVRAHFLDWFAAYISERQFRGKAAVESAVRYARWELRHRFVARCVRRARRMLWGTIGVAKSIRSAARA